MKYIRSSEIRPSSEKIRLVPYCPIWLHGEIYAQAIIKED